MRNYYEVLEILKTTLEADPLVTTITNEDTESIDLNKKNLYPIVDMVCTGATIGTQTITFNMLITAVDIREHNNVPSTSKFVGNDNKQDNLNTTLAILNRLFKTIAALGDEFTIIGEPTPEPVVFDFANQLDGWQMTLVVETPNTEISIC